MQKRFMYFILFISLTGWNSLLIAQPLKASDPLQGDPLQGDPLQGDPLQGDPLQGDPITNLIKDLENESLPRQSLAFQDLYENSHYSVQTDLALKALEEKYMQIKHQELKAEAGLVLVEFYRQLGKLKEIETIVKDLGFCSGWKVLGPLKPDAHLNPNEFLAPPPLSQSGSNRMVFEYDIPAYGGIDFYSHGAGHFGFFNANLALFPSQLTAAYFRTWFYSDGKTPLRLGTGWYNSLEIWIDETPVRKITGKQIPHIDQDVVFFKIRKGWHQLTLRTESDDDKSILGFFARITDLDGKPVQTRLEKQKTKAKRPEILDPQGIETSLIQLAKDKGPELLACIMLQKEIKKLDETPKNLLLQALKKDPDQRVMEKLLLLEENPNTQWEYLNTYLEKHPGDPWGLSQKGTISLSQSRYWEAREYAQEVIKDHPDYWKAQLLENNALSQMNLFGETLRRTEEIRAKYGPIPWVLMDLCDLYLEMGLDEKMSEVLHEIRQIRHTSSKFNTLQIQYIVKKEQKTELQAFFEELTYEKPDNLTLFLAYMDFLTSNNQMEKAESLLVEKVGVFPENPFLLEKLGNVQMELRRNEALDTLKKVLVIDPQNPKIEKLIQMYQKEGHTFFSDHRLIASNGNMAPHDGIVIDIQNTVKKVSSSGQASVYYQIEYLVLEEKGIKELPGHSFSYAPLRQKPEILKAEIKREDQTILLSKFGRTRLSDPAYRTYYDLLSFNISFPALEVGDRVILEYRIDDVGENMFGSYYGGFEYFSQPFPVNIMKYSLILPADLAFNYKVMNMVPEYDSYAQDKMTVHEWTLRNVPILETEPLMPPAQTRMAHLSYSSFNSWDDMASWYNELIKEQLELDPETRQIVKEITAGITDRRSITEKIHEFVITHTRYVALEFGIHGYKPYQVNRVCARQFGDCKDKASLMTAMLREAGVEASIAIVRTSDRGQVALDPANLGCFNHAITYVPEFDLFLDGTAEYSGLDELPEMDQGATTFIVDKFGKGVLRTIPISNSDANLQERHLDLQLMDSGVVKIEGNLAFHGIHAASLRRFLEGEKDSIEAVTQLLSSQIPGVELSRAQTEASNLNEPVKMNFEGSSNQLLIEGNSSLPLEILGSELLPVLAPTSQRDFPVWLGVPESKKTTVRIMNGDVPVKHIPNDFFIENDFLKMEISFKQLTKEELQISYFLAFKQTSVPVESYQLFRSCLNEHDRFLQQTLSLR